MSDLFLRIFEHLLPDARAWRLTHDKPLRQLFAGLTGFLQDIRDFIDLVWLDLDPTVTRELDQWDRQFALPNTGLSTADRRTRLAEAWKATGGQSPRYITDVLQGAGFDVHLHKFWEPGTELPVNTLGCATVRDPRLYAEDDCGEGDNHGFVLCGEPLSQCGEPTALCGNSNDPLGYLLVNKVPDRTEKDYFVLCGETAAQCGESEALCGNFTGYVDIPHCYHIPDDPAKWPYFIYIGAETFPQRASLPNERRDEFETLCLKHCPAQLWIVVLVKWT